MIELLWDDVLDEFKSSILNFLNEVKKKKRKRKKSKKKLNK